MSVACAGDINGDGYSDVIVGAQTYDNTETDEGAAYVYFGSDTGIQHNCSCHTGKQPGWCPNGPWGCQCR
ncbi:MAG: FG-GAP repeat protein [Chitinophagaceae bacterium]|nr:FG-GAP repeat protein [Chitinophagaceae bacterium]